MSRRVYPLIALVVCLSMAAPSAFADGGDCQETNKHHQLAYYHFAHCDPSGPAGQENCNTNAPVIYGDAACINVDATPPCNDIQDFSCVSGANTAKGACFPAIAGPAFVDDSDHAMRISITLEPGPNQEAQLSRLTYFLAQGGTVTAYGIRVTVNGTEIFKQTGLPVPNSWQWQELDLSGNPAFTVSAATTFDFEFLGYGGSGGISGTGAIEFDTLRVWGGCCATTVSVEETTWSETKETYREEE